MEGQMCFNGNCGSGFRRFLTKEERIDMLKEYKEYLDLESKGVSEKIAQLEKNN